MEIMSAFCCEIDGVPRTFLISMRIGQSNTESSASAIVADQRKKTPRPSSAPDRAQHNQAVLW